VSEGLDDALAAIDELPAAPTPEAEAAAEQYRTDMETNRTNFAQYLELAPAYRPSSWRTCTSWRGWTR
jgi:hypothetical protein